MGAPVGWTCYTNRVDIARFLVNLGASPTVTYEAFLDSRPPLLAAGENVSIDAVDFFIDECGVNQHKEKRKWYKRSHHHESKLG